jgi:predicted TIM-barrel fold metal-dependent hydrolase
MWVRQCDLDAHTEAPPPVPARIVSNEEFVPPPPSPRQREYAARLADLADRAARRQGLTRRAFLRTGAGMAAALAALNRTFGDAYIVHPDEVDDPDAYRERWPKEQFIFDMQTHHTDLAYPYFENTGEVRRYATFFRTFRPDLDPKGYVDELNRVHYVKEVFLDSDTVMAFISGVPTRDWSKAPLPPDQMAATRRYVNELAGSRRLLAHGLIRPNLGLGDLDEMERQAKELKVEAWKFHTGADLGEWVWSADDEKRVYPFWEKTRALGIKHLCFHKGLPLGAFNVEGCMVNDIEKAARDWPDLNFMVYHSGFRGFGTSSRGPGRQVDDPPKDDPQEVPWVSDLLRVLRRSPELKNIYFELGNTFHQTSMFAPEMCMHMLGQMLQVVGPDRILWGTDSIWGGGPQSQIERFRRIRIRDDLVERYRYPPLTDEVKAKILGLNAAKLFGLDPQERRRAIETDKLSRMRDEHHDELEPSNTQYGWVWEGSGEPTVPVGQG